MKNRYRKFRRGNVWWVHDSHTNKQSSLKTKSKPDALRLLDSMNQPYQNADYHLDMARTHLKQGDVRRVTRSWQHVFDDIARAKSGNTRHRAYARNGIVKLPSLESFEARMQSVPANSATHQPSRGLPARLDVVQTAKLLGFAEHDIQVLMAAGRLSPLGDPAPNAPKWFAAVEVIQLALDQDWLNKSTREIGKYWRRKRERRKTYRRVDSTLNNVENGPSRIGKF